MVARVKTALKQSFVVNDSDYEGRNPSASLGGLNLGRKMTEKKTYKSDEIPDVILQEFEECLDAFLLLIGRLAKEYGPRSIHAGLSRAHLDFLRLAGGENFKEIIKDTADYYVKEADKMTVKNVD